MKTMKEDPDELFIALLSECGKSSGLGDIGSKMFAILYLEPEEISMEELAKRTGFSLAAASTNMKLLVNTGFVKRKKKPGSKKLYFYMEKDMLKMIGHNIKAKFDTSIPDAKEKLPGIIEMFRKSNNPEDKKKLQIVKAYYGQVLIMEKFFEKMITEMSKMWGNGNGKS